MAADDTDEPDPARPDALAQTVAGPPAGEAGLDRTPTAQRLHDEVRSALFGEGKSEHDYEAGTVLAGRYRILGWLGEGGMGRVYRARDLVLDEDVAIKFLPRRYADRSEYLDRFVREVRVARQVSHPNVCRVHDIGNLDGQPFLSMEYIDGEDLGALLGRIGRLGRDKAVELAHELCSGLAALHERGLVHRDLKPSNVMIDGRGRARITDFGLAAADREISDAEIRDGTPAYQAPEQLAGRDVSARSDVYALGAILFEMFSGTSWTELPAELTARAAAAQAQLIATDPAVAEVVRRCLDPDPGERPAGALEVAATLPGGDPLLAAMAAGRMPSPEAVANARTVGGLSKRWGLGLLVATGVLALTGTALRMQDTILDEATLPIPVLEHKAEERLETLGWTRAEGAVTGRFLHLDQDQIDLVRVPNQLHDDGDQDIAGRLRDEHYSPVRFAYRQIAVPEPHGEYLSADDPPVARGGDALLELDVRGRLVRLQLVPPGAEAGTDAAALPHDAVPHLERAPGDPPWDALFEAAGLDPTAASPAPPRVIPPAFADGRRAWIAHAEDAAFRIEAATLLGHLVWWEVREEPPDAISAPRSEPEQDEAVGIDIAIDVNGSRISGWIGAVLGVAVSVLAAALAVAAAISAIRTLRRAEVDRAGARRLALSVTLVLVAVQLLSAQNLPDGLNSRGIAFELASGLVIWLGYLMIEPYARRSVPRCLVGWSRLLRGRVRDPLVGREVVLGMLAAAAFLCVEAGADIARHNSYTEFEPDTLLGTRFIVSHVLSRIAGGAFAAIGFVLLLALFESLFRRRLLARTIFVAGAIVLTVILGAVGDVGAALQFLVWALVYLAFVLYVGLLGAAVLGASHNLLTLCAPDLSFAHWWSSPSLVPAAVFVGLAAFGFVVATAPTRRVARSTTSASRTR